jgi:hypothetical protein
VKIWVMEITRWQIKNGDQSDTVSLEFTVTTKVASETTVCMYSVYTAGATVTA